MSIQKLEFYEGAAVFRLIRSVGDVRVRADGNTFVFNERCRIYAKYCTRPRSPWTFAFTAAEQQALGAFPDDIPLFIGLVCGSDGIATLRFDEFQGIAGPANQQIAVSCARRYNEHYLIAGPAGQLDHKVPPSAWGNLFRNEGLT